MCMCRMIAQLLVLGYLLVPIFQSDSEALVMGYAGFMLLVAVLEAVQRPQYTYKVCWFQGVLQVLVACGLSAG